MNQRLRGGVAFLVLGLLFFGGGAYSMYPQLYDVNNAEPVNAEVVSSAVDSDRPPGENDRRHYVRITYAFEYEGDVYTSTRVFPGDRGNETSQSTAESLQEEYSAGESVTAYVVDGDPERAFLVNSGPPYAHYLIPGFGAVVALVGALGLLQSVGPGADSE
jgi:hypothetical protein